MSRAIDTEYSETDSAVQARIAQLEGDVERLLALLPPDQTRSSAPPSMPQSYRPPVACETPLLSTRTLPRPQPFPMASAIGDGTPSSFAEARSRAQFVRKLIRRRRRRDQFLPADLFADPAWDMMLDLYAAHYEGRTVSVSSLCIAAAVPATTALRWIKTLTDTGAFVRVADPDDGRRIHVHLGEETRCRLDEYFEDFGD